MWVSTSVASTFMSLWSAVTSGGTASARPRTLRNRNVSRVNGSRITCLGYSRLMSLFEPTLRFLRPVEEINTTKVKYQRAAARGGGQTFSKKLLKVKKSIVLLHCDVCLVCFCVFVRRPRLLLKPRRLFWRCEIFHTIKP